ncbi:MAG: exo-alpha-sialidase [Acidobacteria bacterium]|nr:exo-alpha-sialidase [Acidobacteriota bacterium]
MIIDRTRAALLIAGVAALVAACSPASNPTPAAESRQWSVHVQPVASPAGSGSSAPQLTASDRGIILSWFEPAGQGTALKFAEWTGSGWSATRTAAAGDHWFVSYADVPSVIRMADGTLVANWLEATRAEMEAYDLWLSYSTDEGRTWAKPLTPHHDGTQSQHGFASLFEMPGKGLGVVWLDGRDNEFDWDHPDRAAMMLRFAAFDRDWTQIADEPIDLRVCECCPTSAAVTSDGVITVYRDRSQTEVRDISASRFENGTWTDGVAVHEDNWEIFACPVNGDR